MINNIEKIKPFLEFTSDDDFYYLQVLKRKKENPELGRNSYLLKPFHIISVEYLEEKMDEIINLCDYHNARAYINLNRRSFEKIADEVLIKFGHQNKNKDYYSMRKIYDSVCGLPGGMNQPENRWVVDLDIKSLDYVTEVSDFIDSLPRHGKPNEETLILDVLETLNGYHLITRGFRSDMFKERYPEIDLQKNNPTILYIS